MELLFWVVFIVCFFQGLHKIIIKKDYFNIYVFIFIGIYFPLILYFLNWSILIDNEISPRFYYIFLTLSILIIFVNGGKGKTLNDNVIEIKIKKNRNKNILLFGNIFYLCLFFLENYTISGYMLPALHQIDVHAESVSFLSLFTGCLFVIILVNFLYWYVSRRKMFLVWTFFLILLPLVGKSARMAMLMSGIQLVSFVIFIYINDKYSKKTRKKKIFNKKWHKVIFLISTMLILFTMVKYTDYRMNYYGKYDLKYEETIGYIGPKRFSGILSVYYGYFPLSFNNLNVNLKYKDMDHNYWGLYSYKCVYFGIFRLHNLFELDPYLPERSNYFSSGSATVPTGFLDLYFDYGIFIFIPISIGILIYIVLKRRVLKRNATIGDYALYFYWVPLWTFMSFQNSIYGSYVIVQGVILYSYVNYYFEMESAIKSEKSVEIQ